MNTSAPFNSLELGVTKPIAVKQETIYVEISSDNLLVDYGKAFVKEAIRKNPELMTQVNLTEEEVANYCEYLLAQRISFLNDECKDWRKLKALYIPSYIQYVLSMVGEVNIRELGLLIKPSMEPKLQLTFDEALAISDKISFFVDDLQIVKDAMPRSTDGNVDVMSCALINGYVRALQQIQHPASTYVAAFMGMKLKEETAFQVLYRRQYDDVALIQTTLLREKSIF